MMHAQRPPWASFVLGFCTALMLVGLGGLALMTTGAWSTEPPPEPEVPRVDVAPAVPVEEPTTTAELLIGTKPPARVFLDGEDTQLTTPIYKGIALHTAPGRHTLMFETADNRRYFYDVILSAGTNRVIIMGLGNQPLARDPCHADFVREEMP
ncbi:MAG: hypothetical protein AB2A00_28065 [Myxococcota bacterium]